MVKSIAIEPKYKKENGLWVLDIDSISVNLEFDVVEKSIVAIPPKQIGGNHRHPRTEAFIALNKEVRLVWLDDTDERHELKMDELIAYIMPSEIPHAVINEFDATAHLLEFADGMQHGVSQVSVIE